MTFGKGLSLHTGWIASYGTSFPLQHISDTLFAVSWGAFCWGSH